MSFFEGVALGILVVLVIFIVFSCSRRYRKSKKTVTLQDSVALQDPPHEEAPTSSVSTTESFGNCEISTPHILAGMCGDDDKFVYAMSDFGAPGRDFKDWVMSQSVDPQVLKNHAEFVKDRGMDNPQNITGRVYSPDSHDSYDPIPWQGLRRPQAVATCNPTQVPDVDYSLYDKRPTFTWRSS